MSDLIDRRTLLQYIEKEAGTTMPEWLRATILSAPAAEPERKTARWIEDGYSHYKDVCCECGEPCATYVANTPRDRFCKWCGAKMEGNNERFNQPKRRSEDTD